MMGFTFAIDLARKMSAIISLSAFFLAICLIICIWFFDGRAKKVRKIEIEEGEGYRERFEVYKEFHDFWQSIPITWNEHHLPQKKFMFDFLFRVIVSCWDDFTKEDKLAIQSEARSYLKCSQDDFVKYINDWRRVLPHFSMEEHLRGVEPKDTVQLLEELIACDDVCTEYTFGEGVMMMPFFISYPPEYAFKILKHMGYERLAKT